MLKKEYWRCKVRCTLSDPVGSELYLGILAHSVEGSAVDVSG